MDNLITSCQPCNSGKSDRELSDIPQTLQAKAAEVLEREAQIKGYQHVLQQKKLRIEDEASEVLSLFQSHKEGYTLTESAMVTVRMFIDRIGFHDVYDAMERACTHTHIKQGQEFRYFCGICWNRINGGKNVN